MDQTVLHPDFPVVEGNYFLSKHWEINLPLPFNRRVENDSLVLWRSGLVFWMTQFENKDNQPARERVLSLIVDRNHNSTDYKEFEIGSVFTAQYFSEEKKENTLLHTYHYVIASEESMLSIKVYTPDLAICKMSKQICQTVKQYS